MKNTTKKAMLLAALLLLTGGAWAQKTHPGHYLYHGERVEVPVNSEVALVYFRTAKMDTVAIHRNYQCLNEVALAADKADTLYACEVALPEGDYAEGVAWLKAQPEVWDVEPVIGTTERVPVSNMFFVKLREQGDASLLAEAAAQVGARHEGPVLPGDLWHIVTVDKQSAGDAMALSTQLGESGKFADVDPGFAFKVRFNTAACPTDTNFYQDQWNMQDMDLCDVWDANIKGAGVKVALIDNGVYTGHPEFVGLNIAGSYNAYSPYGGPATILTSSNDPHHGTKLAGIIFSDHNHGYIAGIAPEASLVDISFAVPEASYSDALVAATHRAFSYAVDSVHSDVILCAWNLQTWNLTSSLIEGDIVNAMENGRNGKGTVVVFASGNTNNGTDTLVSYPANFDERILVAGSLSRWGEIPTFSRRGDALDVVAPGIELKSTRIPAVYTNYAEMQHGTSLSAAHVAGLAALILSRNNSLSREQVDWIIKRSTKKPTTYTFAYSSTHIAGSWNSQMGYGKVNAKKAIQAVDALAVTQSQDLIIRDYATDVGKEPTDMSISVNGSPDIKVIDPSTGLETNYLIQGKTYQVKVLVRNLALYSISVSPWKLSVYWTNNLSNLRWAGSWNNCGCSNVYCDHVSASGSSFLLSSGDSHEFTVSITLHRDLQQQCAETFPRPLYLVAMIGDGADIDGYSETDFPLEGFVRGNNRVAWRSGYTLDEPNVLPDDPPPFPPFGINAVSPNPATGTTTVEYQTDGTRSEVQVWLTDAYGNVLRQFVGSGGRCTLDLQGIPAGHYYVHLIVDGNRLDTKVLIVE